MQVIIKDGSSGKPGAYRIAHYPAMMALHSSGADVLGVNVENV